MVNKFELDAASAGRVEKKLQALESQNAALNKEVMKHIKDVLSNKDTGKLLSTLKASIDKHAQFLNKKEFDGEVGEESLDNVNFDIDDKGDRDNFLAYLSNVDIVLYQEFQAFFTELDQLDAIKINEEKVVTKETKKELSDIKNELPKVVAPAKTEKNPGEIANAPVTNKVTDNKTVSPASVNVTINSPVKEKTYEEKKSDAEGFNKAPTLQEVVVVGKKKTPENSSPVKPQLPEQQGPVAPEKDLPSTYESQELSSHINYELKGHEFIVSGERFDITTDEGMTKALAVIAAGGNLEKAKTLRKNFKGVNLKDFDIVMGAVLAQWPEKMTIRALKKIAKANGYDRKGAFLGVDAFKNDYKQMGMIFSALGKEGVGAFYAIRTSKVDIKEVANTVLDKKSNDLTKISSDNVFDYLVDRNSKSIQGKEKVTEVVGEKSLLDTIIDMADWTYTTDKSKKVLIDGPKTAQVIEAAIMHIDGRGRLNGAAKKQLEAGEKVDGVGVYNLANFAKLIKENPVFKVYYSASLVDWVANKRMDLHNVVRKDTWEQKMFAKEDANGSTDFGFDGKLNTLNTEQKKWFEEHLKNIKDPDAKKWFDSLDAEGKKSFMYALTKVFQKTSFITSIIGIKAEDGKPFNEKTLMDAVEPDFKWFKDEGGKGPRIVPMFRFKKEKVYSAATGNLIGTADLGRDFFIGFDMPIVSAGMKVKVNRGNLDKAAEEEVKSLNSVYGHLSAHTSLYIGEGLSQYLLKKENRQYLKTFKDVLNVSDAQLGAIVQADLRFAKDYNAGIEYISNKFADRLQMLYEVPSGITTLEQLKEAFAKNLTKAKKEFKSYDKENQGRLEQYQQVMLAILEASPVFAYIKNNPKASTDLNAVMKGIAKGLIAENEKEKMQTINGETKLTKIGLLGRAGLIFDLKTLADPNGFKDMIKNNAKVFGAGLQYSLTSFLVKYAPDKDKYEYMDASLKEGKDISRIDGLELADGVEKIAAKLEQSMNVDGMIVRAEKGKLVFALDPEHPVTTAEGYAVTSITQLLNIYVDTKNEKNVALAADGKSLIVGDASALGYVNRNYCNDQSHYLIIGKGGVNGKTWVHKSTDLPTPVADVKEIKTDVFTEAGLKKALMEDPSLTGTLEQKKALVESIVPAYLTIDGKTHEYKVNIQGKWVVFDHKKNGLNISCDKAGECEQVEITDKVGKVFFEQAEYIREEAPKSSDILSENGREIYKVIKEELFTNVDFGPLVSKYKSNAKDTEIKKAYESLVKGDHTTAELIGLLKLLQTRIAADKGKYVAGDIAKVNGAIDKIITKITRCDSLDCKLIVNVFMSKLPQSVGHTAKSGEFIAGGKMEKIFAEGYNHKGKKLDAIKKMKLPEYVTTHINRVPSFTNVMKNAGLSKYTNDVLKNHRATLLNKNPNATSWEVKQDANLLMFNANMTPGVDEFNLIPPGEAMIAHVNGQEMISEINNPAMEEAVLKMLSKEQFGGYKALLEKKYNKKFSDKEVQDFVAGREITVNGKSVRHDGKGLVFAFYGGCFNESLGFEIGKIVEKVKVEKISGSVVLKDLVGMEFNTDAQTVTMTPYLNSRTITHTIGADLSEKVRKTNAGSNGGGNGNGDGDSNGGGGGTGGGGSGGGGGTGGGGGSGGGGGNGGGSGGNGGGGGGG